MKKIIAAAVAAAFVAPAFAADVTVGGHVEYIYKIADGSDDSFSSNETEVNISATEELSNGVTVSATINLIDDLDTEYSTDGGTTNINTGVIDTQGTSLTLAGSFGSISLGDVSGALDATGDYTDVAPSGGSFYGDGNDHAVSYTLPTIVEGLKLVGSFSPDNQDNNAGSGTGIKDGAEGFSATYSVGSLSAYYGYEKYADSATANDKLTAYGVKYSFNGVMVAYETADFDDDGNDENMDGLAVTYTMGDVVLGYEKQKWADKANPSTNTLVDETVMFVEYNMGPVDLYISAVDADEDTIAASGTAKGSRSDSTRIGVEYVF